MKTERHTILHIYFIQIMNANIGYNIVVEAVLWKNYENFSLYRFYCMKICEKPKCRSLATLAHSDKIYNCLLPLIYLCGMLLQETLLFKMYFKFYSEGLSLKLHIIYISHVIILFKIILQTSLWSGKTDITVRKSLHKNIIVKSNFCIFSFAHKHMPEMKKTLHFWLC
jgi:hypothetical protein